jgi:hypothetical protein
VGITADVLARELPQRFMAVFLSMRFERVTA